MVERIPEIISSPEIITPDAIKNRVTALLDDDNLTVEEQHVPGSNKQSTVSVNGFPLATRTEYVVDPKSQVIRRLSRDILHGAFSQVGVSVVCDTYTNGSPVIEIAYTGSGASPLGQVPLLEIPAIKQQQIAKLFKLSNL